MPPGAPPLSSWPTVSVALCTHNGARYVAEQVRSICAQHECLPLEIVLSDDASGDATVAVVRVPSTRGTVSFIRSCGAPPVPLSV